MAYSPNWSMRSNQGFLIVSNFHNSLMIMTILSSLKCITILSCQWLSSSGERETSVNSALLDARRRLTDSLFREGLVWAPAQFMQYEIISYLQYLPWNSAQPSSCRPSDLDRGRRHNDCYFRLAWYIFNFCFKCTIYLQITMYYFSNAVLLLLWLSVFFVFRPRPDPMRVSMSGSTLY